MSQRKQTLFASAERDTPQEVQKQSSRLLASAMLRQLLDAVLDLLLLLNDKRQVVFINQRLLEFLACGDPRQVYGARPGELLRCIHADETWGGCGTTESCRHCGAALAILASQEGKGGEGECRIVRKEDGEALTLRVKATPVVREGRRYTIFCMEDISHEKRRQVLRLQGAGVEELQQFRGKTFSCASTVIEEINEHRIVMAAEKGELNLQPRGISSLELLKQVVQFYETRPEAQGKTLRIQRQARDTVFLTDPILLKQVLGSMVLNALEACAKGETVMLNADKGGNTIDFNVHNPGYMPREVQLQVFQRGFTTKGEGRGLGTYAMRLLTEKGLKGKVSFLSTERVGTVFRLNLPELI